MAFDICKVQNHTNLDGNKYLLDANIWLKILSPHNSKGAKDAIYTKFFSRLTSNNKAKIVLPALMVSEVVNRIIREIYMPKYLKREGIDPKSITGGFYKEVYRKSEHFKTSYNLLADDIHNYHSSTVLINDGFGTTIKYKHVLSNPPEGLDFNDYYYYQLAKNNNYILVTDDGDFWVEGIKILTENFTLLSKQKDEIGRIAREKLSLISKD